MDKDPNDPQLREVLAQSCEGIRRPLGSFIVSRSLLLQKYCMIEALFKFSSASSFERYDSLTNERVRLNCCDHRGKLSWRRKQSVDIYDSSLVHKRPNWSCRISPTLPLSTLRTASQLHLVLPIPHSALPCLDPGLQHGFLKLDFFVLHSPELSLFFHVKDLVGLDNSNAEIQKQSTSVVSHRMDKYSLAICVLLHVWSSRSSF